MTSTAETVGSVAPAVSPTLARTQASSGRGVSACGLIVGIYFLIIAVAMLIPTADNLAGAVFIAVVGVFFVVVGVIGFTRASQRLSAFDATHGTVAGA